MPARSGRMRILIERYRSFPGEHCGSVAMRGLLHHYCGLELPESAVFGLGGGLDCAYVSTSEMDPPVAVFGRTATLEVDIAASLGVDYRERPEPDDDQAWRVVREEVVAGRPTMLSGDILYLDYREFKVHFPAHRFVLVGFDDAAERVFVADRIRPEPEICSYRALRASRNPPEGISTHNLWGRFHGTDVGRSLPDAARLAIGRCARRMLGEGVAPAEARITTGLAGLRRLARELPAWAARDDASRIAGFNARCIERFGNGGGNFRRLYAGFLEWARALDPALVPEGAPALAVRAADGWTSVAAALARASEEGVLSPSWRAAAERAAAIVGVEEELFQRLADRAA